MDKYNLDQDERGHIQSSAGFSLNSAEIIHTQINSSCKTFLKTAFVTFISR